jgi:hypothetical protein
MRLHRGCEDAPLAWDTLEDVDPSIVEADPRSNDQVFHSTGHEDLAGAAYGSDPSPNVHGDPADLVAGHLRLSSVEPGPDLQAKRAHSLDGSDGTTDAACRPVEDGEDTVSSSIDFAPAMPPQLLPDHGVMSLEKRTPSLITHRRRTLRGADDIGKQHRGENAVGFGGRPCAGEEFDDLIDEHVGGGVIREGHVVDARQFD